MSLKKALAGSVLVLAAVSLSGLPTQAEQLTAREIMVKNFEASRVQDSTAAGQMVLFNSSGAQRVRETATVSKLDKNGKDQKRLVRFLSPADVKGTALLTLEHAGGDDDIWIYLPAMRKVRRIVSQEKSNSFMGSEFAYVDILDPEVDDYQHTLAGNEDLDGAACFKVESIPSSPKILGEQGYSKKISWVRADNFVATKIDFYDKKGALLKTLLAKDITEVDPQAHKWLALHREMTNHQTKRRSELVLKDVKVNTGVADDLFTPANLERRLP